MPPRKKGKRIVEEGAPAAAPESAAGLPPLAVVAAAASASEQKRISPGFQATIRRVSPGQGMDEKCRNFIRTFRRPPVRTADQEAQVRASVTLARDLYLKSEGFWPSKADLKNYLGEHVQTKLLGFQGEARKIAEQRIGAPVNAIIKRGEDILKELAGVLDERRAQETELIEKHSKSPREAIATVAKRKYSQQTGQEEVEVKHKGKFEKEEEATPKGAVGKKHKRSPSPKATAAASASEYVGSGGIAKKREVERKEREKAEKEEPKAKKAKKKAPSPTSPKGKKKPAKKGGKKKGGVTKTTIYEAIQEWRDQYRAYLDVIYAEAAKAKIRAAMSKTKDEGIKAALQAQVNAIDKTLKESSKPYVPEAQARYGKALAKFNKEKSGTIPLTKDVLHYDEEVQTIPLTVNEWDSILRFVETYYRLWQLNQKIMEDAHIQVLFGHEGDTEEERELRFLATHRGESAEAKELAKLEEKTEIAKRTTMFTSETDKDNELFKCLGLFRANLTPEQFEDAVNELETLAREDYEETRIDRSLEGIIEPGAKEYVQRGLLRAVKRMQDDLAAEGEEERAREYEDILGTGEGCKSGEIADVISNPLSEKEFLDVLSKIPKQAYRLAAGPRSPEGPEGKFSAWVKNAGFYGENHVGNDLAEHPSVKTQESPILKEYWDKASKALDMVAPRLTPAARERVNDDQNKVFLRVSDVRLPEYTSLLPKALQQGKVKKHIRRDKNITLNNDDLEYVEKVEELRGLALEEAELILRGAGRIRVKAVAWMLRCGDPRAVDIFLIQVADALNDAAVSFHFIDRPGDIQPIEEAKRYLDEATKTFNRTKNSFNTKWEDVAQARLLIEVELKNAATRVAEGKATAAEAYEFAAQQVAKYAGIRGRPNNVIKLADRKKSKEAEEEDVATPYKKWGLDIPAAWALDAARDIQRQQLTVQVKGQTVPVLVSGKEAENFWKSAIRHKYIPKELENAARAVRKNVQAGKGQATEETLEPLIAYLRKHGEWESIIGDLLEHDYLQLGAEFEEFRLTKEQVDQAREAKYQFTEIAKREKLENKEKLAAAKIREKEIEKGLGEWERAEYANLALLSEEEVADALSEREEKLGRELNEKERAAYLRKLLVKKRHELGITKRDVLKKGQTEQQHDVRKYGRSQFVETEVAESGEEEETAAAARPGAILHVDLNEEEEEDVGQYYEKEYDTEKQQAEEEENARIEEKARKKAEADEEKQLKRRESAERRKLAAQPRKQLQQGH
jgi:hypothetical protein